MKPLVILLHCPDRPGLVADLAGHIFKAGGNIVQLDQHTTLPNEGQFFMRVQFELQEPNVEKFQSGLNNFFSGWNARWELYDLQIPVRLGILVSKIDHCLFDLLYRYTSKEFNVTIPFIISNHSDLKSAVEKYEIPFYHLPVNKETKHDQEKELLDLTGNTTDFLVLARYMQILSEKFIDAYTGDVINIHHSFLPSFKGAYPYRRAYERGVKVIGATAHFVTPDLDEGPIIEQVVERVSHRDNEEGLKLKGKNLEKLALASAVRCYVERRIIRYGNRTIVFS